ncbi:hypothetical protein LMG6000_05292 [Achromobacter insolitus]|uniref:Bacteriophage T5 Orf172 DNA-binding domain-containing protein n=2 Tax=Achromobacter insolitus TaxID=217204 RepID=A0A6S7FKX3_9BURK|nr:hypothetical protein LMG6000_05292 [Achromobacter insolitus]CAB3945803.1 hypothetical protein LMG5997_05726 [Achromobacter insolitus]
MIFGSAPGPVCGQARATACSPAIPGPTFTCDGPAYPDTTNMSFASFGMIEEPFDVPSGAWLYVAMDIRHPARTKLGMTDGAINARTGRQTANPGMMPVVHLPLNSSDAYEVEQHLHKQVNSPRERHMWTGKESEWFECTPPELVRDIKYPYTKCFRDLWRLYNDDDGIHLHTIAKFPPVDYDFTRKLASRTSNEEFERYIAAYNGVRQELGLRPATDEELYDHPNRRLYGLRSHRRN